MGVSLGILLFYLNHSVDAETYRLGNPPSPHALNIMYHNVTTCKRYLAGFYLKNQLFSSIRITMDKPETIEEGLEIHFIYK